MAKTKNNAVVKRDDLGKAPSFVSQEKPLGNENVDVSDLVIPRVGLIQSLSPEIDNEESKFIDGAKEGMMFNSLTRELYGETLDFIPIFYRKEYLIFKTRKSGGGFRGSFPDELAAAKFIKESDDSKDLETTETGVHFVFIINANGTLEEAVISMASTKLKISRELNSLVRLRGVDRFAGVYTLGTSKESNDKGKFSNFKVANNGWATKEQYAEGKKIYDAILAGYGTSRKIDFEG